MEETSKELQKQAEEMQKQAEEARKAAEEMQKQRTQKWPCSEAPSVYNAVQCGSVISDVGIPLYPCCDNNTNKRATDPDDGNCTWYAWYKAKKVKGWVVPSNWGWGGKWCDNASITLGWQVSPTPSENTIACSSRLNHVAWVVRVSDDKKRITVEEMICKVPLPVVVQD